MIHSATVSSGCRDCWSLAANHVLSPGRCSIEGLKQRHVLPYRYGDRNSRWDTRLKRSAYETYVIVCVRAKISSLETQELVMSPSCFCHFCLQLRLVDSLGIHSQCGEPVAWVAPVVLLSGEMPPPQAGGFGLHLRFAGSLGMWLYAKTHIFPPFGVSRI